jgi:hypothetical protein
LVFRRLHAISTPEPSGARIELFTSGQRGDATAMFEHFAAAVLGAKSRSEATTHHLVVDR